MMETSDDRTGKRLSFVYNTFGFPHSSLVLKPTRLAALKPGMVRVAMQYAPINPSDLIPITGAYRHRINLPATAGYEGVGRVIGAHSEFSHLLGRRVLPLRGEGTWQSVVDCPASCAVEVPHTVSDLTGARAYINPLAALMMLRLWPVRDKVVLLTAAGSNCAEYLGRWARSQGAQRVFGIYRSESRLDRLLDCGLEPISMHNQSAVLEASARADITFDAIGGEIATIVLANMRSGTEFVGYGLMTGNAVTVEAAGGPRYHRFHLRDQLPAPGGHAMQKIFAQIWPRLEATPPPAPLVFDAQDWRGALDEAVRPGGQKPVLDLSQLR